MGLIPENKNEYDDAAYQRATTNLEDAVWQMWEAGASADDIENEVEQALRNVE